MSEISINQFLTNAISLPLAGRMITSAELPYRVGQSLSWIYKAEKQGLSPRRVRLGKRGIGWRGDEVEAWLNSREAV